MKKTILALSALALAACSSNEQAQADKALANEILANAQIDQIRDMGQNLLRGGFNAGDGYAEVWIRDFNTFVNQSAKVVEHGEIRENILKFFHIQEADGNIADGFVEVGDDYNSDYYKRSPLKNVVYHKNTVETDQESSLIQAVRKYVNASGDRTILAEEVAGQTVLQRMEAAMDFLLKERFDQEHGLLWGATTADWGDVQPEHDWGVALDENSHLTLDIYDNAMMVIALNDLLELGGEQIDKARWTQVRNDLVVNINKHLWDAERGKYRPHVYLDASPFPADFDEDAIYYHGGTAVAIEAGLMNDEMIIDALNKMVANVKASGAGSIGLTLYPTYPEGSFKNKGMYPYGYQNGGDWTWFGGRMIQQLIANGKVAEAWEHAQPMFDRVVANEGFYEWYTVDNKPNGSGMFRGSAGVLLDAIDQFEAWAAANK